jgi:hypothetical protein
MGTKGNGRYCFHDDCGFHCTTQGTCRDKTEFFNLWQRDFAGKCDIPASIAFVIPQRPFVRGIPLKPLVFKKSITK